MTAFLGQCAPNYTGAGSGGGGSSLTGTTNSASPFLTVLGSTGANTATGVRNTAVGYQAGNVLNDVSAPTDVTAIGAKAGLLNTISENTFVGSQSGVGITTGNRHVLIGFMAGGGASGTVQGNTAVGYKAGLGSFSSEGVFIGDGAGSIGVQGNDCVMVGANAGANNTAVQCTMVGSGAGTQSTAGTGEAFFGYLAGNAVTGSNNSIFGHQAGDSFTTGARNSLFGKDAGGAAGATGMSDTVMIGYQAGLLNTANQNTFIGSGAGSTNVAGTGQCFIGYHAGLVAAPGSSSNTLVGSICGLAIDTGASNTCVGNSCAPALAGSNSFCTMLGAGAGNSVAGNHNIIIGFVNASTLGSGTGNIIIGDGAQGEAASSTNICVLGGVTTPITNLYSGKGVTSSTAAAFTWNGVGGSGSNNAGANIQLAGGFGTGTAANGYIGAKYGLITTTGSTLHTVSTLTNYYSGVIYKTTADLTLTANVSTTGTLIGAQTGARPQGTLTLDANLFDIGTTIRVTAYGKITQSAAGPTFTIAAKLGTTVIATATIPANAGGVTNGAVKVEFTLTCRTTGSTGTVQGDGAVFANTTAGTLLDMITMYQAATTVDQTGSLALDMFGTWSAGTAGNAATFTNVVVELM